jgi:hypothetical protein
LFREEKKVTPHVVKQKENIVKKENIKNDNKLYLDDDGSVVNKVDVKEIKPKKTITQKIGSKFLYKNRLFWKYF